MTSNDNNYSIVRKLFQPITSHENNMKLTEISIDPEIYSVIESFKVQIMPGQQIVDDGVLISDWVYYSK